MSNIPSSAVHAAFTPVQRASNELIRARKIQADKASHHTEDVEELDDTGVSSVHDQGGGGGGGRRDSGKRKEEPEEKVEIATLDAQPVKGPGKAGKPPQLDISA